MLCKARQNTYLSCTPQQNPVLRNQDLRTSCGLPKLHVTQCWCRHIPYRHQCSSDTNVPRDLDNLMYSNRSSVGISERFKEIFRSSGLETFFFLTLMHLEARARTQWNVLKTRVNQRSGMASPGLVGGRFLGRNTASHEAFGRNGAYLV